MSKPTPAEISQADKNWLKLTIPWLVLVVLGPLALVTVHLVEWAQKPEGLALDKWAAILVPAGLDVAEGLCVVMALWCAYKGWRPGKWGIMVWVFSAASALVQYAAGRALPDSAQAWVFPALALVPPVMLEFYLAHWRRLVNLAEGTRHAGGAKRFLVAPWESIRMLAVQIREEIPEPAAQRSYVRNRVALSRLGTVKAGWLSRRKPDPAGKPAGVQRLQYAQAELKTTDLHRCRVWLQFLRFPVSQADVDAAQAELDRPAAITQPAFLDPAVWLRMPQAPAAASRKRTAPANRPVSGGGRIYTDPEQDRRDVFRLQTAAKAEPDGRLSVSQAAELLGSGNTKASRLLDLAGIAPRQTVPTSPGLPPVGPAKPRTRKANAR